VQQVRPDARVVLDELRRLGTISDRLLLLASSGSPRFLDRGHGDVGRLVRDAVIRWRPTREREWGVRVDAEGTVPGDEERLRAALDALIENAVNATEPHDRVSVALTTAGEVAIIEVSDTGVGIPPADLERIFKRFSTARVASATRRRGTGLGLPIVKAIVDAHGGSVAATSNPGKSTTFRIRLPGFRPAAESYGDEDAAAAMEVASA
jgi:two-component system, OmpR family, sensor kinase